MEEEKAAAYYDELTRKGQGAARFKQGLGFSSSSPTQNDDVFTKQTPSSSSSFLSNFVKASSPTTTSNLEKQAQLQSIQNKLKKKPDEGKQTQSRDSRDPERDRRDRDRKRDHRDRDRERDSRDRDRDYRDRDKDRDRDYRGRDRDRDRDYRDRNREKERERDYRDKDRDRDRERDYRDRGRDRNEDREKRKRRSVSPRDRRREERNDKVDYSRLIEGYDKMIPAERVKAKMKLQLAETAEKDETKGMGTGWERFEFNKDAPLDDEEVEAADDDAALVKHIGQTFRFSAIEARREEQIKAAHDEAMFGASAVPPCITSESEPEVDDSEKKNNESGNATSLFSEKVLSKQQGSWRDRARKL
ncbi:RNA-binding protein 25-like [Mangifera indica]|uniref:RNA-binding protein 25-like n=1 Tax=Mangifera indica TaxID=29780 RepID=UPI001CFA4572|nr:RNA-binding protein 25-like [Mangifera indica]XP_044481415.1 RNA-binding protein 25-like [Mangifera indica]XP_044481416.1 RNA-binding protein 25-like [Mangifera indica]